MECEWRVCVSSTDALVYFYVTQAQELHFLRLIILNNFLASNFKLLVTSILIFNDRFYILSPIFTARRCA